MSDIVARLRNQDYRGNRPPEHALMTEAADEIERLERWKRTAEVALAVKDNHDHFDCTADRVLKERRIGELETAAEPVEWHDGYRHLKTGQIAQHTRELPGGGIEQGRVAFVPEGSDQ